MKQLRLSLLALILCFSTNSLWAQLSIELGAGAELGWWVQNNGYNDTLPSFHQGYDRSHLSFMLPAELSLSYQYQAWRFSLGMGYRYFDDNVLIGSDNARGNYSRYRLQTENRGINLWTWQAGLEYSLLDRPKFSFSPFLSFGGFASNATIPEAAISKTPLQFKLGIELSAVLSEHIQWYFRPRYARFFINYREPVYRDLQQNVYSIGILTGIRFCL